MEKRIYTPTRRELLTLFGATVLAACSRPADNVLGVSSSKAPSSPDSIPEGTRLKNMALENSVSIWRNGLKETKKIYTVGVEAQQVFYKDLDKGGILIAWNIPSWGFGKQVEIQEIKALLTKINDVTPADTRNDIQFKANTAVAYTWRDAELTGRLDNPQAGPWKQWKDGSDGFSCQVGKNAGCNLLDNPAPQSGYNWPSVGGLYQMVYTRP